MAKKNKKKKRLYTVMFIPDGNGRTFFVRINRYLINSIVFFLFIFVLGVIILVFKSGEIGTKLQLISYLHNENKRLSTENSKLKIIVKKIESMEKMSGFLRRLAFSVDEDSLETHLSKVTYSDSNFEDNSLDAVINNIHTENTVEYKKFKMSNATKRELSVSIPNISPVNGWITKRFLKDKKNVFNCHLGVDFAAKKGTPIRSTAPGIVENVENDNYFGLIVTIKHKFGFITRYGHCMQILISKGDYVKRGQTIALLGNTGLSSAPHVHYEILKDNENVDPLKYIFDR